MSPPPIDADPLILLAMVPGMGIRTIDFHTRGFVSEVEHRFRRIKVAIIDPGPDSYLDATVEARILAAIAEAQHQTGAARLWLAGISLGCQGILRCVRARPGLADGLLLLTPYLASTGLIAEVVRAGGLRHWAAMDQNREDQLDRAFLAWLGAAPALPPMLVGQAMQDRFIETTTLLSALLPPDRLISVPGAHEWESWSTLWRLMLDRNPFSLQTEAAI